MSKIRFSLALPQVAVDLKDFGIFLRSYIRNRGYTIFSKFELGKDAVVDVLYRKRGKYSRPFLHFGVVSLGFLVITVGPLVLKQVEQNEEGEASSGVIQSSAFDSSFYTAQAEEVRQFRGGEIITHIVQERETISNIAGRYSLDGSTVLWENNLTEQSKIKPGSELRILPVDGVRHKVARGETIYSVGKKYGLDENQVQAIIDYPFNEFLNDETFELATGQFLIVPGGIKKDAPAAVRSRFAAVLTPDAGTVTASGAFIWPATGRITQSFSFYHKAIDIANKAGGPILAADSGVVTTSGWPDGSGYGNRVTIDHGNGFVTLYAHMSVVQVQQGQRVNRGDLLGQMGSTGRSTGTHLHFEIRQGGGFDNPLSFLR